MKTGDFMQFRDGVVGDEPQGWLLTQLGEIVWPSKEKIEPDRLPEAPYLGLEHIESRTSKILGHGHASEVKSTKAVFRAGDVLYGKLRPYLNKVCVPDFGGVCSTDFLVFDQRPWINNKFLLWFLLRREVVEYANHHSTGVELPRIGYDALASLDFLLPPLTEQKRIVARVEECVARVNSVRDRLSRVPAILKRFRQAVLAAACSGKLTEDWRNTTLQRDDLTNNESGLPDSWQSRRLEEIISEPLANGRSVPDAKVGFPVLRLTALRSGYVDLKERKIGAWTAKEASRFVVHKNDFFVCRGNGSLALVGRGGLVDCDPDPVAYPDTLIRVRPSEVVDVRYLALLWNSAVVRQQIESLAHTTAGIHKVSQKDLAVVTLPTPPLSEQREIVLRVESLFKLADSIDRHVSAAIFRADKLTQSMLAKAFRGELVPTEAELARREGREYEPASVLLERIRKEREAQTSSKPERKRTRSKSNLATAKGKT